VSGGAGDSGVSDGVKMKSRGDRELSTTGPESRDLRVSCGGEEAGRAQVVVPG
jgi:hypothetical protein